MKSDFCSSWHLAWKDSSSKYVSLAVGYSVCQFFHLPADAFVPGQLTSPPYMWNLAVSQRLGWILCVYFLPQFPCSSHPGFLPKHSGCSVTPRFSPLTPHTTNVALWPKARGSYDLGRGMAALEIPLASPPKPLTS